MLLLIIVITPSFQFSSLTALIDLGYSEEHDLHSENGEERTNADSNK